MEIIRTMEIMKIMKIMKIMEIMEEKCDDISGSFGKCKKSYGTLLQSMSGM
jgi:hypothetical protein